MHCGLIHNLSLVPASFIIGSGLLYKQNYLINVSNSYQRASLMVQW